MSNKYDLELAIDTYRAQNGKESEITLFGDNFSGFEYGSNRFATREQAIWWLKQQKPNHEEIRKMIANERKNYPESGLNPLFEVYERYYKQVQQVQQVTSDRLQEEKIFLDILLQGKVFQTKKELRGLNSEGKIDMSLQGIILPKGTSVFLTGRKRVIDGNALVEYSRVSSPGKSYDRTGWVYFSQLTESGIKQTENEKPAQSHPNTKVKTHIPSPDYREQPLRDPDGTEIKKSKVSPSDKDSSVESIFKKEQSIIFKDGAYYLTGPKGNIQRVPMESLLVNLKIPKEAPENLKKSVSIVQDFALVLDAYLLQNPSKKEQHEKAIQEISKLFSESEVLSGQKVLDVTSITNSIFSNNNFLKNSDLFMINEAFRINDDQKRHFAVLQFIRDRIGQSDLVAQKLIQENQREFGFPADNVLMNNGDLSATGLGAEAKKKVSEAIDKARSEANSNWMKNKEQYIQSFEASHPGKKIEAEEARLWNEKLTILMVAKREIVYQTLYNKVQTSDELKLLQDILGAGTWKMSDKSWDISKEVGGMIAMEAIAIAAGVVTAGVATGAINAVALGRNAYRGAKALEAYNTATKTRQTITTATRILGSGVGFEAGVATTRSYIENGDFTSMHSKEGYVQSVAMMGVMSGIGKLITAGKLGQGIQFKEGAGFSKNILPFIGQVAIEGTAIFGTSAAIGSVIFDRQDNWTLEQMAQAMFMASIFKGAGKMMAGKDKNGNVEVKQRETRETPSENSGNTSKTLKEDYLTRNSLLEKVTRLRVGEKIEIEGFPGYTISKANKVGFFEIKRPDGAVLRFSQDKLEVNLEALFNKQIVTKDSHNRSKSDAGIIEHNGVKNSIPINDKYELTYYYDTGTSYFKIKDATTGNFLQNEYVPIIKLEEFLAKQNIRLPDNFYNQLLSAPRYSAEDIGIATSNLKQTKTNKNNELSTNTSVTNVHNGDKSGVGVMEEGRVGNPKELTPGASSELPAKTAKDNHDDHHNSDHDNHHGDKKAKYEWKWKNIDTVLQGDNRKFRQIFPFAENNVWSGIGALTKGELHIMKAIQNSVAWVQNQTFSQIYIEMTKPWRNNPGAFIRNAGDNIRTLLLSGESGKFMSADRLGKLGIVVSASAIDYVTSDSYKEKGLFNAISGGIGYTFNKYILNPKETVKLYEEILLLNWVAITLKEVNAFVGAGTGVIKSTVKEVRDRLN